MLPQNSQVITDSKGFVIQDSSGVNQVEVNISITNAVNDVPDESSQHPVLSRTKKLQDDLEKTGSKIKQHEDNLKFLKGQKSKLDDVILDLQGSLGKYVSASAPKEEHDKSVNGQSEEDTIEQILKHENSAAAIFCLLKSRPHSNFSLSQDNLGVVATLGKVDDQNLSRILSEYLGLEHMLAIVCKTYEGVKALETYDSEGLVNKFSGIHELGASLGQALHGPFLVMCLDKLRQYPGKILTDDPQRRLDIVKPRVPTGELPAGFLGYAVNMIHIDRAHLFCMTSSGYGLRETLFYNLFSRLQVYRTRAEMFLALPLLSGGAVSLDGGIIRNSGVYILGSREDVSVTFPGCPKKPELHDNYNKLENQMKQKKWERERIQEDMRREQALLDEEKYNFKWRKQNFIQFLADSSSIVNQPQVPSALQNQSRQR